MADNWADFKAVKSAVPMEMALNHYGVRLRRVNETYLRGECPLPTHPDDANRYGFGVNTEKNAWACHVTSCVAARGGRRGGNVLDFVAGMEGCSIRDAALKLVNWFRVSDENADAGGELVAKKEGEGGVSAEEPMNLPLEFRLRGIDPSHPYLGGRGIRRATAERFGVGYFPGRGSLRGRVVIPVHNERGELVAYAGRAVGDEAPKYKLPTGFRKSHVLYNLHRAAQAGEGKSVLVVEGFFDAMKVHQAGFPRVVSLMGATLSDRQETLLRGHFDSVVLFLDGDPTGRAALEEIALRLVKRMFTRVIATPEGEQPDRLSSEGIQELLSFL